MSKSALDLIDKIGQLEASLTEKLFISPIYNNTVVATRVMGMAYTFSIPKNKEGWYKIRPIDAKRARIEEPADLMEIEEYLKCLDKVRVVLVMRQDGVFMGVPDKTNKCGLNVNDLLPVYLCNDFPLEFDRIIARYDGNNLWYDRVDSGNDPSKGDYLRESLSKIVPPDKIKFIGLTLEEKQAYTLRLTYDQRFVEDRKKEALKQDVEFAGGRFISFDEKSDHYVIKYKVDGQQFTSRVTKDPRRMVVSAGLCLNSNDRRFDLKSLVSVIREGQHRSLIHITS